jgi:hypothetical protein
MFENVKVVKACERHSSGGPGETPINILMNAIKDNWLRNDTRSIIKDQLFQEDDKDYYKHIHDTWDFDGKLHVTIDTKPTGNEKDTIQNFFDLQLGTNKVVLD